ncbi:hypothetical protein V6N12_049828 [Hibiscus sabdariffa]|uniref:RNase H type-1 domain-containing protein n=1 Tax=Hibiscus sabdariffa TaxID=183260 RepID=A0ABR2GAM7_9ROSI
MSFLFEEWFVVNLRVQGQFVDDPDNWEYLLPTICWLLWKMRCSVLLDPSFVEKGDVLMGGKRLVMGVLPGCNDTCGNLSQCGKATAGGVVRDVNGDWIFDFARNLDICSSILIEVWAVHNVLLRGVSGALPGNAIVEDIPEMLTRYWVVVIHKISRDLNKVADALASLVCDGTIGVWLFDSYLEFVSHLVHKDICDGNEVG